MARLRIKVIEPGGFKVGTVHHEEGDIFTSDMGTQYRDAGWAEDAETGETGERIEGNKKLIPDPIVQTLSAE